MWNDRGDVYADVKPWNQDSVAHRCRNFIFNACLNPPRERAIFPGWQLEQPLNDDLPRGEVTPSRGRNG